MQGDHTPDSVKFPDSSRHSSVALAMLSVTDIMPALVLLSVVGHECNSTWSKPIYLTFKTEQTPTKYLYRYKHATYNKQFYATFHWQDFFPRDIYWTFNKMREISPTAVKFPDMCRLSRQVVTLNIAR